MAITGGKLSAAAAERTCVEVWRRVFKCNPDKVNKQHCHTDRIQEPKYILCGWMTIQPQISKIENFLAPEDMFRVCFQDLSGFIITLFSLKTWKLHCYCALGSLHLWNKTGSLADENHILQTWQSVFCHLPRMTAVGPNWNLSDIRIYVFFIGADSGISVTGLIKKYITAFTWKNDGATAATMHK